MDKFSLKQIYNATRGEVRSHTGSACFGLSVVLPLKSGKFIHFCSKQDGEDTEIKILDTEFDLYDDQSWADRTSEQALESLVKRDDNKDKKFSMDEIAKVPGVISAGLYGVSYGVSCLTIPLTNDKFLYFRQGEEETDNAVSVFDKTFIYYKELVEKK